MFFIFLFVLACVLSGIFGALHNQISYTVSPEYFTKFKFQQFGVSPHFHHRLGAATIGWNASWWMGIVIGIFLIPAGLLIRCDKGYLVGVLRAFVVVILTTILFGACGWAIASMIIPSNGVNEFRFRGSVISDAYAFRCAGAMHNSSYLGGMIGIFAGLTSLFRSFLAENARLDQPLDQ